METEKQLLQSAVSKEIVMVPVEDLKASPTNPRSEKETGEGLDELVESIKANGILNPVLFRKIPGKLKVGSSKEIVAGHRRVAAARVAGLAEVPAIECKLDDAQVEEAQLIENVQRKDLDPVEEANAYEKLRTTRKLEVAEIAARTGKSASHVSGRLALLNVGAKLLAEVKAGKVPLTVAQLVGRIPDEADRKELIEKLEGWDYYDNDGPITLEAVKKVLYEDVMRDLAGAAWHLDDAELVKAAGPCSTCPKNSANQKELFSEIGFSGPKVKAKCLDGKCWSSKVKAWGVRVVKKAKDAGVPVATGEEAERMMRGGQWTKLDDTTWFDSDDIAIRTILKKAEAYGVKHEVKVAIDERGRTFEMVTQAVVNQAKEALSSKGKKGKAAGITDARRRELYAQKVKRESNLQGLRMMVEKVEAMAKSPAGIKALCLMLARNRVKRANYLDEKTVLSRRFPEVAAKKVPNAQGHNIVKKFPDFDAYYRSLTFEQKIALGFEAESASCVYVGYGDVDPFEHFPDLGLKAADAKAAGKKVVDDRIAAKAAKKPAAKKPKPKKAKPKKAKGGKK